MGLSCKPIGKLKSIQVKLIDNVQKAYVKPNRPAPAQKKSNK